MKTLKHWSLHQQLEHHVELTVDGQHTLCLYVLEENLFRVLLKREGQLALDRTGASLRSRMCRGKAAPGMTSAVLVSPASAAGPGRAIR